jgi:Arc/MetJ-type ribon-helix-helix transcriptional regulator
MAWGFRDARRAERRRRRLQVFKFFLVLGSLVALGAVAYQSGAELVRVEVAALREEIRRQSATIATLNSRIAELESARQAALSREAETNARYQREVPSGPGAELYKMLQGRLAGGMTMERMAFVIRSATMGDKCENQPTTRRFQLAVPATRSTATSVAFDNSTVLVSGEGEAATNEQGAPHNWFDPAKPVRMVFTQLGGARSDVEGRLPLHHSIVRGSTELRFAVTPADLRGFVTVVADRCTYP